MNQIIVHSINATGQLTMLANVNTNGTGVSTTNADPLFSQAALTVYKNYLFAVNPSSNSLSMFMINQADATQLTLLSVQSTYGVFPVSVAANDMYACVLTGGSMTGIRCFTYNATGLYLQATFDRNLTSYVSQTVPPTGPPQTMSQILFTADNQALIVSIKGVNATVPGCLLFYMLTMNRTMLGSSPMAIMPMGGVLPFSVTLVGSNGLLITDPGAGGVLTMTYSSSGGMINNNSMLTPINSTRAGALCWSTYSPNTGNYYVIAARNAVVVELNVNLTMTTNAVQIIQYYQLPNDTGALETTVVSLAGKDYLFVLGTTARGISGYKLVSAANVTFLGVFTSQSGNMSSMPKLAGLAAFVNTRSSTPSAASLLMPTVTLVLAMVCMIASRG